MQVLALKVIFIVMLLSISSKLFGHVALDYPVGGETYIQGQTITIQWHIVAFHEQLNWDLYFSSDGGANWQPIQLDIPVNTLSYDWVVPAVVTSQGRIKIYQDNVEHDYLDVSDDFNIVPNTSPPFLDSPANDVIIECDVSSQETAIQSWLNNNGGASATHYCGTLIWTNDFDGLSNDCGSTGSALVTFTATDECGSTFSVATLTVADTHPPMFILFPTNLTVECDGQGNVNALNSWLSNHGGAQASDVCSNVVWTNDYAAIGNGCGATGVAQVIFKATDACGNFNTAAATFTIADHISPVISQVAHDTILECGASNSQAIPSWLSRHGGAQAEDICGNVSWSNNFSTLNDLCGNTGSALVIFTAIDDCGNSATTSASISIQDHTAPTISAVAQDTTSFCSTPNLMTAIQSWMDRRGGAQANDACGNVSWSNDFGSLSDTCASISKLVTFTASDECGNNSTSQALFTLLDTTTTQVGDTTVFAPVGAAWYYSSESGQAPWKENALSHLFLVEKDTVILGQHARVIGCYLNNDGQLERMEQLTKYVSTIGEQVYYKVGDEFVLLYDFSAQVGDTIHSRVEHFGSSLGCIDPDSTIEFSYVIDSVTTIQVDGENLVGQYVSSQIQFPGENWGFWSSDPIIERMGNWGLGSFWWGRGLGCIFEAGYLRCYIDGELTWHSAGFNEQYACDYLDVSEIDNSQSGFLYPNPTSGVVSFPKSAKKPSVYSLDGRPAKFSFSGNEIDLSENPPGLYVVKFEIGNQTYYSKIVLE